MVGQDYTNFFLAMAGAAAALIGLLFVAISVAPESTVKAQAPLERRAVATSAYTALINAFVISLGALIPQPQKSFGGLVVTLAAIGVVNTLSVGWQLVRAPRHWRTAVRRSFLFAGSLALYGFELTGGLALIRFPNQPGVFYPLAYVLIGTCVAGMARAWQLLGARRTGLTGWLSVLNDVEEGSEEPSAEQTDAG
jgi:hypothetical protein